MTPRNRPDWARASDSIVAVVRPLPEQEGPPYAASDTVVPASDGWIDPVCPCDGQWGIS